jgi:ribonuclease P protein component
MRKSRNAGGEADLNSKPGLLPPARLKKRADFVQAAKGRRVHGPCFTLQAVRRKSEVDAPPRFGFTVTKKIGGAVLRNRIRRRLKEALRLTPGLSACPGYDYVILGRQAALAQEFATLQDELTRAIAEVHARSHAPQPRLPHKTHRPSHCATPSKPKD